MKRAAVRYVFTGKQIGEILFHVDTDEIIKGLESGKLKLAPSFLKYPDGHLEIVEVSIIPADMELRRDMPD